MPINWILGHKSQHHDRGSDMTRGEREKKLCVILTMFCFARSS